MEYIQRKNSIFIMILLAICVTTLIPQTIWGEEKEIPKEDKINEDIAVGDTVICTEAYETIEEDTSYGPATKTERIFKGVVTKIKDGKIHIIIEGVGDVFYIKKLSSWVLNETVAKPPPFNEGDIYECLPRNEEHKKPHSVSKVNVTVKKIKH